MESFNASSQQVALDGTVIFRVLHQITTGRWWVCRSALIHFAVAVMHYCHLSLVLVSLSLFLFCRFLSVPPVDVDANVDVILPQPSPLLLLHNCKCARSMPCSWKFIAVYLSTATMTAMVIGQQLGSNFTGVTSNVAVWLCWWLFWRFKLQLRH